jgi:hypothetical protein
MKSKLKTKDFMLASTKFFFFCLLMAFGSSKAFAQCTYVTIEDGKETKISIPCDFPVKYRLENSDLAEKQFKSELLAWQTANPNLKDVMVYPIVNNGNVFIEIPLSNYNSFTDLKKKRIDTLMYFYKIIQPENK